jgi:hypothetical protein
MLLPKFNDKHKIQNNKSIFVNFSIFPVFYIYIHLSFCKNLILSVKKIKDLTMLKQLTHNIFY